MIQVASHTDLGTSMLMDVLAEAVEQVTAGKGEERHGNGAGLLKQPWRTLADQHGAGFLTGQAGKKLGEAATLRAAGRMSATAYERELLGAIVYTAFAIMHGRLNDGVDVA